MSKLTISVVPIDSGWMVRHEPGGEHLVFLSGGRAEAAARRVLEAAITIGAEAELRIHTRDGEAVYQALYAAE